MSELWENALASTVALVGVSAVLIAVGVYIIGRVRRQAKDSGIQTSQWINNFRELHAKGELSDQEYRTIKAVLTERFQAELNEKGEPG